MAPAAGGVVAAAAGAAVGPAMAKADRRNRSRRTWNPARRKRISARQPRPPSPATAPCPARSSTPATARTTPPWRPEPSVPVARAGNVEPSSHGYTPPADKTAPAPAPWPRRARRTSPAREAAVERQPEERVARTKVEPASSRTAQGAGTGRRGSQPPKSGWWQRKSFFLREALSVTSIRAAPIAALGLALVIRGLGSGPSGLRLAGYAAA